MAEASWTRLERAAWQAHSLAYAPYSHFRVGAAIEVESGEIVTGCNVENASYGLAICAERAAVASAVGRGHRSFRRLVVATDGNRAVPPCGACRQVLAEFGVDVQVVSVGGEERRRWQLQELIPDVFRMDSAP